MFKSGFCEGGLLDGSRLNWDGDGPRPVSWSAWYPVSSDENVEDFCFGSDTHSIFTMGSVARGATICVRNDRFPLVLLSHGTGGSANGLGWLARGLAERGFICVSINHHGNNELEPYRPEGFLCWWERATDISFVLQNISKIGAISNSVDHQNIFTVGFSLGGYTALCLAGAVTSMRQFQQWHNEFSDGTDGPREFPDLAQHIPELAHYSKSFQISWARHKDSFREKRIKGFICLAPAPPVRAFKPGSIEGIDQAVLILAGEADTEAPYDQCARWLYQQNPNFELVSLGPDVGHYVFLCQCTDHGKSRETQICVDASPGIRQYVHNQAVFRIETFLRRIIDSP